MTLNVTTSSSVGISTTLATIDGDTQTVDSYATEQFLLDTMSDAAASDGSLVMLLEGEATAVGEDTLAVGSMSAAVNGMGSVATAEGGATFAAAASSGTDIAFATADSYGVLNGADLLIVITGNTEIAHQGPDGSLWVATSQTTLYGADFDAAASTAAADSADSDLALDPPAESESAAIHDQEFLDELDIEGNIAILQVDAQANGSDTLLQVEAGVLAVEDTLSTVSAQLSAVID
jgi:hypothetical protein